MATLASADPRIFPVPEGYVRPWLFLALRLRALVRSEDLEANVYEAPPQGQMAVPALIVTPGDPWVIEGDEKTPMQNHREQYLVTAVASASDPNGAIETLYNLASAIMEHIDTRGWWWIGVSGPIRIDSGGVQYLGVTIRVGHSATEIHTVNPNR